MDSFGMRRLFSFKSFAKHAAALVVSVLIALTAFNAQALAATGSISGAITVTAGADTGAIDISGTISGTVTDAATGNPLSGISVSVYDGSGWWRRASAVTDSLGRYQTATVLPTGSYYVQTGNSQGYLDELYDDILCSGDCSANPKTAVAVTMGMDTGGVDFALDKGGSISGAVTDATTGSPLSGVSIYVNDSSGSRVSATTTDSSGRYRTATALVTESYFVQTSNSQGYLDELYNNLPCTGSCDTTKGTPVAVTMNAETGGIDFALDNGGTISGTVTDAATGSPLSGAALRIYDSSGNWKSSISADSSGQYRVTALPTGSYFVQTINTQNYIDEVYDNIPCDFNACSPTAGTAVAVTLGADTGGIDFALDLGGTISGAVTDAATGSPLPTVSIYVYDGSGNWVTSVRTNSVGQYRTQSVLPTGSYYVRTTYNRNHLDALYDNLPCAGSCDSTTGTAVAVTVGMDTGGIDFALDLGGTISGAVTDAATGNPLSRVTVDVYDDSGLRKVSVLTDNLGHYRTAAVLPTGSYFVRTSNSQGYLNEVYNNISCIGSGCDVKTGAVVAVMAGSDTGGIDFALDAGGTISGTATDATTGDPLWNVTVYVYDGSGNHVASAATDRLGRYRTASVLATGSYYVRTNNNLGYLDETYNNISCSGMCDATTGTAVAVTKHADTGGIDFALDAGGSISGMVADAATGKPLSARYVDVYDGSGNWVISARTNSLGQYRTSSVLPTASYRVQTTYNQNYLDELYDNLPCSASCDTRAGTAVAVTAGVETIGIDFALDVGGSMSGMITDAATGNRLSGISLYIYDGSGKQVTQAYTDALGQYRTSKSLLAGNYYARTSNGLGYMDEIYGNILCGRGLCDATTGTAVAVTLGVETGGIDFALDVGGSISGTVTDAATGNPLSGVPLYLLDGSGSWVASVSTDSLGRYRTATVLSTGSYYIQTNNSQGYLNEAYDNILCSVGCSIDKSTAVAVTVGAETGGIDFALDMGGTISGTVTDAVTGDPLSNVGITIYDGSGTQITSASTDRSGRYRTSVGVLTGSYYVRASNSQGYLNEVYDNVRCVGFSCASTTGTAVAVTVGADTGGIDFALEVGGTISGTITDAVTGNPLSWTSITVYDVSGRQVEHATTDSMGQYRTSSGLPTGAYYVVTNNSQGYINEAYDNAHCVSYCLTTGTAISVTVGAETGGIDFALDVGGTISGTVTDVASGSPLPYISITVYDGSGYSVSNAFTDSSGKYLTRTGLPTGSYFVRTSNGQSHIAEVYDNIPCAICATTTGSAVAVTVGADTGGIDFALDVGGVISGSITEAGTGNPLAKALVTVYNSSGDWVTSATTDDLGQYQTATVLPTGNYFVRTDNAQGYLNERYDNLPCSVGCDVTTGAAVAVTAGTDTAGIDFALDVGGTVSGTITDAATGIPLANVFVLFYDGSGTQVGYAYTDSLGRYRNLAGLPAGRYYVQTSNSQGYLDEAYDNIVCVMCAGTTGTVGVETGGIDFALDVGGMISGSITEAGTGNPLANALVTVYNSLGDGVTSATTDDLGQYQTATVLSTGNYFVRTSNDQSHIAEAYDNIPCANCATTAGSAVAVTVGAETGGIDFALDVGGMISGNITEAGTGNPLANALVTVYNSLGDGVTSATTDDLGQYQTATVLPTGNYFVRTSNGQSHIAEAYDNIPCANCATTTGSAVAVTVGADTGGIDFALDVGGVISGSITEAGTGTPLAKASVIVYNSSGGWVTSATTDDLGQYQTATVLPTGNYFVRTDNAQGYLNERYDNLPCAVGCGFTTGAAVAVTAGTDTAGIDFALDVGGTVSGTITDAATGIPLAYVFVFFYDGSGTQVGYAYTDSLGRYRNLAGLPAGSYYAHTGNSQGYVDEAYGDIVCARCDSKSGIPVAVTAGGVTVNIDFALNVGGTISGAVIDAVKGRPLDYFSISIFDADTGKLAAYGNASNLGHYQTMTGLPTGNYFVATINYSGYINEVYNDQACVGCDVTTGAPVSVTEGSDTGNIDFALDVGGTISGVVTDSATGRPLAGVEIEIYDAAQKRVSGDRTDLYGRYRSSNSGGLPNGQYSVRTMNNLGYINEVYKDVSCPNCSVTDGLPVTVTVGVDTGGINFALDVGGTISGLVTDVDTGAPLVSEVHGELDRWIRWQGISDLAILLYDASGNQIETNGIVSTDATGRYRIKTGLPSGDYFVRTTNTLGFIDEVFDDIPCVECVAVTGAHVKVTAGVDTGNVDFGLGHVETLVTDISFADAALASCVAAAGLTYAREVASLQCRNQNIDDVSGVENLPNLRELDLSANDLVDVSALAVLTDLVSLNLADNRITRGVSDLAGSATIDVIDLSGNGDIPCADLDSLEAALALGVVTRPAKCRAGRHSGFGGDDLVGSWWLSSLATGSGAPWWQRGSLTASVGGSYLYYGEENTGIANTLSGTWSIASDGVVTGTFRAGVDGTEEQRFGFMDIGKTLISGAFSRADGTTQDWLMVKRSNTAYRSSDLEGRWTLHKLASGNGMVYWSRADLSIDAAGLAVGNTVYNDGSSKDVSGVNFSVAADGTVMESDDAGALSVLDADRTIMVGAGTWQTGTPGATEVDVAVRKADTYLQKDLKGVWRSTGLASGAGAPWWEQATFMIGADGAYRGSASDSAGNAGLREGTFVMQADGSVLIDNGAASCDLDAGKTVMVCTLTWSGGDTTELKVMTKISVDDDNGSDNDTDGDGVPDFLDRCKNVQDINQRDTDNDGYGNRCDPDLTNDGFVNFTDLAALKSVFGKTVESDSDNLIANADFNGDRVVDFGDLSVLEFELGTQLVPRAIRTMLWSITACIKPRSVDHQTPAWCRSSGLGIDDPARVDTQ